MTAGFNPMRWECGRQGCFNVKRRPKIEVFAGCFPRRINFGDVDGLVEYGGFFCLLEWKGQGGSVSMGQRLSYLKWTGSYGNIVFIVNGDAETMTVTDYSLFWEGKQLPAKPASIDDVKARMRAWVHWIDAQRKAIA